MILLVLTLLAPATASPPASDHNLAAMAAFDRGDLETAYAEFSAAYTALPDPAGDRAAREAVTGSLRSVLLKMHGADPADPTPLCRLTAHLRRHIDALTAAYPEQPELLERVGNLDRLADANRLLTPFGADACAPNREISSEKKIDNPRQPERNSGDPVATTGTIARPPQPHSNPMPTEEIPPRHLKIAGGVTLGLGGVALGVMVAGIAGEARLLRQVDAIDTGTTAPLTPEERDDLMGLRSSARANRNLAIGTGVAAAVLTATGVALIVAGRRAARARRWSASPWWLPGGGGMHVLVRVGRAVQQEAP